jgi:hypothetical protein
MIAEVGLDVGLGFGLAGVSENPLETRTIEIVLNDNIREVLNNQEKIFYETQYNVYMMKYTDYITVYKNTLSDELFDNFENNITNTLLRLLFQQYPFFEKNKNEIIISTFRTAIMERGGLNGEVSFHIDNISFPEDMNMNCCISWGGVGTQAHTLQKSREYFKKKEIIIEKREFHLYKKFVDEFLGEGYISSAGPNQNQNITALLVCGKEAMHRREPAPEIMYETPFCRYLLNVYCRFPTGKGS